MLCAQPGVPLVYGGTGSQSAVPTMPMQLPERHEAGTPNVPGIAGLLAGIQYVQNTGLETIINGERAMRKQVEKICRRHCRLRLFSTQDDWQTGVLSLVCQGMDVEELAQKLAQRGICVRAGLHCAPLAHRTVGTFETGTVRFSFSAMNHPWQLSMMADALDEIL